MITTFSMCVLLISGFLIHCWLPPLGVVRITNVCCVLSVKNVLVNS